MQGYTHIANILPLNDVNPNPIVPLSATAAAAPIKSMSPGGTPAAAAPNESMILLSMGAAAEGLQESTLACMQSLS